MESGTSYAFDFQGGHLEIRAQRTSPDKNGVTRTYDPAVDLSKVVDQWGRVSPNVFNNLVRGIVNDQEAMKLLAELAKYKRV